MTVPQTKYAPYKNYSNPGYGLLTWLNPHLNETAEYPGLTKIPPMDPIPPESDMPHGVDKNMYFLGGALGQITFVVPEDNLVAVTMGTSESDLSGRRVCVQMVKSMCPMIKGCKPNGILNDSSIVV